MKLGYENLLLRLDELGSALRDTLFELGVEAENLFLGALAFGDVLVDRDPAAVIFLRFTMRTARPVRHGNSPVQLITVGGFVATSASTSTASAPHATVICSCLLSVIPGLTLLGGTLYMSSALRLMAISTSFLSYTIRPCRILRERY